MTAFYSSAEKFPFRMEQPAPSERPEASAFTVRELRQTLAVRTSLAPPSTSGILLFRIIRLKREKRKRYWEGTALMETHVVGLLVF